MLSNEQPTSGYRLFLTDTTTGVRREVKFEAVWDSSSHEDATEFLWTEGNFSCDCNRSLLYSRAANEPDNDHQTCGDERFALTVQKSDGHVVYDEAEDRCHSAP